MTLIGPLQRSEGVGYIDENGEVRIPFVYEHVGCFSEGLANFVSNGELGFLNTNGDVVIEPKFNPGNRMAIVSNFSSGLAPVRLNSREGYIDKSGEFAIPCEFALCDSFKDDIALVFEAALQKRSVINLKGEIASRLQYDHVVEVPYASDLIKVYVSVDGHDELAPAFVDRFGNVVAGPFPELEEVYNFCEDHSHFATALHRTSQLWGYVDRNWQMAIPFVFGRSTGFYDGRAAVSNPKHLWGYIDPNGAWIIPPEYTQAHRYYGNTASVRQGRGRHGKWLIIDRQNTPVSTTRYDEIRAEFEGGFRYVKLDSRSLVIDSACRVLWAAD